MFEWVLCTRHSSREYNQRTQHKFLIILPRPCVVMNHWVRTERFFGKEGERLYFFFGGGGNDDNKTMINHRRHDKEKIIIIRYIQNRRLIHYYLVLSKVIFLRTTLNSWQFPVMMGWRPRVKDLICIADQ